jgi:hypothetical protein
MKFEREDWALFRTIEGLQQKAGVAKDKLCRLVLKELCDNSLDESAHARIGKLSNDDGYFVEDDGRGIDGTPDEIARLFSIARPLVSTKLLRLPTRGALGNGLRVVAGTVLASGGSLTVITRDRRIDLRPERDGTTTVIRATKVDFPVGTRIEISFGPALPYDQGALTWATMAAHLARGAGYAGKSSPWWYDLGQFQEVLYAAGAKPVRELVASLDGCTGAKAGEIVVAANLSRAICKNVTAEQAARLLQAAREAARPVQPERLGAVGPDAFADAGYVQTSGIATFGATPPLALIAFIVEVWAKRSPGDTYLAAVCVNRTPITDAISAVRDKRDIDFFGCGLFHTIAKAPADAQFVIWVNIITPYISITSDGKAPDLSLFLGAISTAAGKAVRKAHRPHTAANRVSQKDIVLDNLDAASADVSGDGQYRFNERQILYKVRPFVSEEIGEFLTTDNFKKIITAWENEHGEILGMYREPRGTLYHPHRHETITLGTLMVEDYERPFWTFNKMVYIEKEGFSEALKDAGWPERHDCALVSSKGFSTRAARDLIDKLAEQDEPITIFCVHDADAYGTVIYQTLQEATKARDARKIQIINLGLEPWEGVAIGLQSEAVEHIKERRPVADYVIEREDTAPDGSPWEEWLQTNRIELNAMTTPEFIEWLDGKMVGYDGKLIPPPPVVAVEFETRLADKVRAQVTERILREANVDAQVDAALARIRLPLSTTLVAGIEKLFSREPDRQWRDHVEAVADELVNVDE